MRVRLLTERMGVRVPTGALFIFFFSYVFFLVLHEALKKSHTEIPPKTLFGEPLCAYITPAKPLSRIGLYGDREIRKSDTPRIEDRDDENALPGRRDNASDEEDEDEGIGSFPILLRSESIDLAAWAAQQNRANSPHPFPHHPLPASDLHLDTIPEQN